MEAWRGPGCLAGQGVLTRGADLCRAVGSPRAPVRILLHCFASSAV